MKLPRVGIKLIPSTLIQDEGTIRKIIVSATRKNFKERLDITIDSYESFALSNFEFDKSFINKITKGGEIVSINNDFSGFTFGLFGRTGNIVLNPSNDNNDLFPIPIKHIKFKHHDDLFPIYNYDIRFIKFSIVPNENYRIIKNGNNIKIPIENKFQYFSPVNDLKEGSNKDIQDIISNLENNHLITINSQQTITTGSLVNQQLSSFDNDLQIEESLNGNNFRNLIQSNSFTIEDI